MPFTLKQKIQTVRGIERKVGPILPTMIQQIESDAAFAGRADLNVKTIFSAYKTVHTYADQLDEKEVAQPVTEEQAQEALDLLQREVPGEFAKLPEQPGSATDVTSQYRGVLGVFTDFSDRIAAEEKMTDRNPPDYSASSYKSGFSYEKLSPYLDAATEAYPGDVDRAVSNLSLLNADVRETDGASEMLLRIRVLQNYRKQQTNPPANANALVSENDAENAFYYIRTHQRDFNEDLDDEMSRISPSSEKYRTLANLRTISSLYGNAVEKADCLGRIDTVKAEAEAVLSEPVQTTAKRDLEEVNGLAGNFNPNVIVEEEDEVDFDYGEMDYVPVDPQRYKTHPLCDEMQTTCNSAWMVEGPFDSKMSELDRKYDELSEKNGGKVPGSLSADMSLKQIDEAIIAQRDTAKSLSDAAEVKMTAFRRDMTTKLNALGYKDVQKMIDGLVGSALNAANEKEMRSVISETQMASEKEMREHFIDPQGHPLSKLQYGEEANGIMKDLASFRATYLGAKKAADEASKTYEEMQTYGQLRLAENTRALYASSNPVLYRQYIQKKTDAARIPSDTNERLASLYSKLEGSWRILGNSAEYNDVMNGLREGVSHEELLRRTEKYITEKTGSGNPLTDTGKERLNIIRQMRDVLLEERGFSKLPGEPQPQAQPIQPKNAPVNEAQAQPEAGNPAHEAPVNHGQDAPANPEQNEPTADRNNAQNRPEDEVSKLIDHLEEKHGAPLTEQFKQNLRELHDRAADARMKFDRPDPEMKGGNELRTIVTYEGLKKSILTDKFNDNAIEVFSKPDSVEKTITLTHMSSKVNYLADREHPKAVFTENALTEKGMDSLVNQCKEIMTQTMKNRDNITTALNVTQQIARQKQEEVRRVPDRGSVIPQ